MLAVHAADLTWPLAAGSVRYPAPGPGLVSARLRQIRDTMVMWRQIDEGRMVVGTGVEEPDGVRFHAACVRSNMAVIPPAAAAIRLENVSVAMVPSAGGIPSAC